MDTRRSPSRRTVECRGETEAFETSRVHTDCYVVFTVGESPERWDVQLFKDAQERGGGYKIFRYHDEERRPYGGSTRPRRYRRRCLRAST